MLTTLLLLGLTWSPLHARADLSSCRIEAFVVQVPNEGCPMERYPVVFKPAQPHLNFAQSLRIELLSSRLVFKVDQGDSPYHFKLKPGRYRFKISSTSNPDCSTIQDLTIKRNADNHPFVARCKDISIRLREGGINLSPSDLVGDHSSPCSPINMEMDQSFFSTSDIGVNRVKVSLIDAQNRRQSCYSQVKVLPILSNAQHGYTAVSRFEQCPTTSQSSVSNSISTSGSITMISQNRSSSQFPHILSQARSGDGEIKVNLSNLLSEGQDKGRAGLIIRENCDASSPFISLLLEAGTGNIHKEFRLTRGADVVQEWEHRLHPPSWLKLKRKGGHFKAFISHNGLHWQLVYSTSMQVGSILYWGLIVKNINPDYQTVATFDQLNINSEANMPYPPANLQPGTPPTDKTSLPDTYHKPKSKTIMEQEQWSIFPNPAQDYLEVTLPIWKDDRATLHLLNSAGKAVLEEHLDVLNGQSHWMNLAKVARGVYYLKLQTIEGQHLTKKVIVDK